MPIGTSASPSLRGQLTLVIRALSMASLAEAADGPQRMRRLARRVRGLPLGPDSEVMHSARALERDPSAASAAQLLDDLRRSVRGSELRGRQVLVVDADAHWRHQARLVIFDLGGEPVEAATLAAARAALAEHEVDLLLLDPDLPDGDGRDLLCEVRCDPSLAGTRVLVQSPEPGSVFTAECLALGADECLRKSSDSRALAEACSAHLLVETRAALSLAGDVTTGLPGIDLFDEAVRRARDASAERGEPWTLCLVGMRRLERVTRLLGEAGRGRALRAVVAALTGALGGRATMVRWRSDQIAVVLPGHDAEATQRLMERVLAHPIAVPHEELALSVDGSAGGVDPASRGADLALNTAQRMLSLAMHAEQACVTTALPPLSRPRVVLAEDGATDAVELERALEHAGFEVHRTHTGPLALDLVERLGTDLLLLDADAPHVQGLESLQQLRSSARYRRLPVALLSRQAGERQIVHGYQLGADDVMVQPLPTAVIVARVRALAARAAPAR